MREYFQVKNMAGWKEPEDWIDINTVADNEILLLVTEGTGVGFTVLVGTGTGTFSIDWGDGTIQTALVGNGTTVFQHQHTTGGTACSLGYNTWKVRIYAASGNIIAWKVARHTYTTNVQYCPILCANIGATHIVDFYSLFYDSGALLAFPFLTKCIIKSFGTAADLRYLFYNCYALKSVTLPTSWGSVTNTFYMFGNCYTLAFVALPTSWGSVTNTSYMFQYCYALTSIDLGASWGSVTTITRMFTNCYSLISVKLPASWGNITTANLLFASCYALTFVALPTSWGSVTNVSNMFFYCCSLTSITIPSSWGGLTDVSYMFTSCYSLKTINNLQWLGNQLAQCNFENFLSQAEFLQSAISIASLLSTIGVNGSFGKLLKCTSIRLTNAGSTFGGYSPQVSVSYTSLDAAALNLLFGDLPTLVGKAINITGCPGAATCTRSIATAKGWTVMG